MNIKSISSSSSLKYCCHISHSIFCTENNYNPCMFAPTFLFRNQWLRYRLVRDYPEQLKFHQSSDHKLSDLVTATDALLSEIVHDTQITTDHQITSESEAYSSTGSSPLRLTIGPVHTPQKRTELYHAALGIRTAISNQAVHISHPPDLHELSLENAQSIVPPHLFNFICLATGLSDEVPDSDAYLNVDNPSKVLSICQDIIVLSGKLTPKSAAFGLTVRPATTSNISWTCSMVLAIPTAMQVY